MFSNHNKDGSTSALDLRNFPRNIGNGQSGSARRIRAADVCCNGNPTPFERCPDCEYCSWVIYAVDW